MSLAVPRRTALKVGAAAGLAVAAAPALPRPAAAQTPVFLHGVASGDPLGTAVVLWTRVTPTPDATPGSGAGPAVDVGWEVAADETFTTVLQRGTATTDAARDHTVHVDVTGLQPYTRYWYRFTALGSTSPVGRTQTAGDDGAVHALRIGLVSCSNFTGGWFTPYRYLAQRDDLDVVLHLGDYVYEYGNTDDRYGPPELAGVRDHVPATEMVGLADYRQRHAQYKSDPDLRAAHAAFPWIVIFDDHEVTNDTWSEGAENHTPETEGDFLMRRREAYQAYLEWMPIRLPDQGAPHRGLRFWRSFSFGPLADLFVVDTRQNRSEQAAALAGGLFGVDLVTVNDPDRVIMEPEQMAALKETLAADDVAWHLIGNQTVFTRVAIPAELPGREQLGSLGLSSGQFNVDQWDGYGADQLELVQAMVAAGADPVVLTGDIHSSWANDVPLDPGTYVPEVNNNSVAVEFVCPSVTSDGFTEILGGDEAALAATTGLQATNRHIRYLDGIGHGFTVLDLTPERVQADWWFVSDRTDPDATLVFAAAWQSVAGSRQVTPAAQPVGARSDAPRTVSAPARVTTAAVPAAATRSLPATGGTTAAAAVALVAASAVGLRAARRDSEEEPCA